MIFSDCCYLTGLIKEALGFKLMTTAAFWCFSTRSRTDSWFCFLELHAKTTQTKKTFFRTVLIVPQATEWARTISFPQPWPCKTLMCTTNRDYHTIPCLSLNRQRSFLNWTFQIAPTVSSHEDIWWMIYPVKDDTLNALLNAFRELSVLLSPCFLTF